MPHARQRLGASGEDLVAAWYEGQGFEVLARNWRHGRAGEIDLIAVRGRVCAICEVKTRSSSRFGTGFDAVTADKQQRLRRLALAWLAGQDQWWDLRFDVAAVAADGTIDVLESAF